MLEDEGLRLSIGRTIAPFPATNHVLEAKNLSVSVYAQNAVLDPDESKACGYDSPLSPVDQTQYVVSVNRRHPFADRQAREVYVRLWKKLADHGYTVADTQMPCLPLPKRGAP